MKKYMVIEHFEEGRLEEIYARFHAKGRLLPPRLDYIDSWLSSDGLRCFQLMQTEDESLFAEWEKSWADLAKFEVIELRDKPDEAKAKGV